MISRRALLGGSAAAVGTLGLGATTAAANNGIGAPELDRFDGRIIQPTDAAYVATATPSALRYLDQSPTMILECASTQDVQRALKYVRERNVPFAVRCGGHNYAGYSTTPGVLISVRGLKQIAYDPSTGVATVGSGNRNRDIAQALQSDNVFIPSGRCTGVGVSGFIMGGGHGMYGRQHGLGCDVVEEVEIVTADGEVLTCNESSHADLFWAIRGGTGGNFGIVTQFKLRTYSTADPVSIAHIQWKGLPPAPVFSALQQVFADAPDSVTGELAMRGSSPLNTGQNPQPRLELVIHNFASASETQALLSAVMNEYPPVQSLIVDMDFWEAHTYLEHDTPTTGIWGVTSRFIAEPLSDKGVATMVEAATKWPGNSLGDGTVQLTQWGGAYNRPAADDTAFVHRDAFGLMIFEAGWSSRDPEPLVKQNLEWLESSAAALDAFGAQGIYQNFPEPELQDWQQQYFGANLPRLLEVKRTYDPTNVFQFPQSLPV